VENFWWLKKYWERNDPTVNSFTSYLTRTGPELNPDLQGKKLANNGFKYGFLFFFYGFSSHFTENRRRLQHEKKPLSVACGKLFSLRTDNLLCHIRLSAWNGTALAGQISAKCLCLGSLLQLSTHSYFSENKSDKTADNLYEDLLAFKISSGYWSL